MIYNHRYWWAKSIYLQLIIIHYDMKCIPFTLTSKSVLLRTINRPMSREMPKASWKQLETISSLYFSRMTSKELIGQLPFTLHDSVNQARTIEHTVTVGIGRLRIVLKSCNRRKLYFNGIIIPQIFNWTD